MSGSYYQLNSKYNQLLALINAGGGGGFLTNPLTTNLDAGGFLINTLGTPVAATDATTKAYVDASSASGVQNPMVVGLDAGAFSISNLATPVASADATTKAYVDTEITAAVGAIIQGIEPVALSNVLISNTPTSTINTGINLLEPTYTTRQQEIIPPLNCNVINQNTPSAAVRVDLDGFYKCEMTCMVSSSVGVPATQGVGISICLGTNYVPYTGSGTLPSTLGSSLVSVKHGIIPFQNEEIEQTTGCIVRLIAGDTISFWLNPNTAGIAATAVAGGVGTSYNVHRLA